MRDLAVAALDLDGAARDLAQLDAAVGGLRRHRGERLRDLEVAVRELRVEVAAGLADLDGAVRRLEDRVAGHRAEPDLTVVGRDLDLAVGGADGHVAVRRRAPRGRRCCRASTAPIELLMRVAPRRPAVRTPPTGVLGGEPRPGRQLDLDVDRLGRADQAEARPRAGDGEPRGRRSRPWSPPRRGRRPPSPGWSATRSRPCPRGRSATTSIAPTGSLMARSIGAGVS